MALDEKHPDYSARIGEWVQLSDTYEGERAVKRKRTDYLAPTSAMVQDGMTSPNAPGWVDYEAYLQRAVFHDVVRDAVQAMVGIMHMKPAIITLPPKMEALLDKATVQGEGLHMLLRRINEAQLVKGRCGLLVDAPTGVDVDKVLPYIAFYDTERMINWDAGKGDEGKQQLELVVLDESGSQRVGFTWKNQAKFRVLKRGLLNAEDGRPLPSAAYQVCVKVNDKATPLDTDFLTPQIGGRTLTDIPFIFVGANDLVPDPEVPPLLGLSNLALAIYRGEADYRQTLFMQGQQTLVIIGGNSGDSDEPVRTGAKGIIDLKIGGDAKYIGITAAGLGEMRQSLQTDKNSAASKSLAFADAAGGSADASGEALRIRVAAKTTTISSVAKTGGAALEQALKFCAEWMGENPDEVRVQPTTDFADQAVQGATVLAFMQAKQLGLPLSLKSMHRSLRANDLTEMTFDEERDQINEETLQQAADGAAINEALGLDPLTGLPPGDPGDGTGDGATPPAPIAPITPPGKDIPITPHARKSPKPLKLPVGKKGASAGKA